MQATRTCTIEDCARKHMAQGYCALHYKRLLKHGDVTTVLVGGNKGQQRAETHPGWKGNQISYSGAHMRVRAQCGDARALTCRCGQPAAHWAYDHTDPDALRSPDGRPYSADPSHYQPMCVPCHKKADLALLARSGGDDA